MTTLLSARYQRAQNLLQHHAAGSLALNATVYPIWMGDSRCFWYKRRYYLDGQPSNNIAYEYHWVNAVTATRGPAFDHSVLAQTLSKVAQKNVVADKLPITGITLTLTAKQTVASLRFTAFDKRWLFDTASETCTEIEPDLPKQWVLSPDGKQAVFTRDHNLWVRDIFSGEERSLTQDGEEDYAYGAASTAWGFPMEPDGRVQARWSPDGNRIYTVRHDTRQVRSLPIVDHVPKDGSLRPQLRQIKVAYPGDTHLETLTLWAIDLDTGECQRAAYPPIPVTRNNLGFFNSKLGWWASDSRRAYFVDVSSDYKTARVIEFDTTTGAITVVVEEHSDTHINLMLNADEYPTFVPLPETNELLWFSERTGWAHLYRYDLNTGELKNSVTQGEWLVRNVVHIDLPRREVFLQTAGRDPDRDPYYRDLIRVNIDSGEITSLVSSDHDNFAATATEHHTIIAAIRHDVKGTCGVEPQGDFAVVTRSRADQVPVSLLVDRDGQVILELEKADTSNLPEDWRWPEPVTLLAADGKTATYGLLYRPSDFNADHSYPVISHGFNQPEIPVVPKGSFGNDVSGGQFYSDAMLLAELGFIVVQIDGRGSPCRNKSFQDECYGSFKTASHIDDHVAGIQQLAERYPYMDLKRVGISAHTCGGSGAVEGLLQHPDFFKVGVTSCLHDRQFMAAAMMGNKYEGLADPQADPQPTQETVESLKGKLLLIQGMQDSVTPPVGVFRLVDALHKANKDFDLMITPTLSRGCNDYLLRRVWDYFVTHLLQAEPPKEFNLRSTPLTETK